jgi:hypothetical protein
MNFSEANSAVNRSSRNLHRRKGAKHGACLSASAESLDEQMFRYNNRKTLMTLADLI